MESVQRFGKKYRLFPQINSCTWCNSAETIVKFCLCDFCISWLLHWYIPRERLGITELILRIAENDITVHIKAGATRNNSQQLLQASALVIKLINFCQNIASKAMDPVLNAPGHFKLSFLTCFSRQYKTKNRMMAKIRTKLESTNPATMSVSQEKRQLLSHASERGKNC